MSNKKSVNKLSLLGDRILIKRTKTQQKVSGNIILPETAKNDKPYVGEVISAVKQYYPTRECTQLIDMPVKEGDKVLLPVFGGVPVSNELMGDEDKNNEYFLFSINDVFAIVEK